MADPILKTYRVSVTERSAANYKVEAEDARAAAANWSEGEFHDQDDALLDVEGPDAVSERQPDGSWRRVPEAEWKDPHELGRYDAYEVHGVAECDAGEGRKYLEQVPDDQAQFWSLYGHILGRGLECIGDFETRALAEQVYARITGRPYGRPA